MPAPGQGLGLFNTFTEMVTTTHRKHKKDVNDNVSNHNALYRFLIKKGKKRLEDGGLSIVESLDYAENGTYTRYSGYDPLNVGASEVLSAAEFAWRNVAAYVTANGNEIRANKGETRIVNLVNSRLKNMQRSMANGLSTDFYSTGGLTNQIGGIQLLIADNGQGSVGGIDATQAANAFWRNIVQAAATPLQGGGAIVPSPTTIESLMLPLWLRLTRGADHPDVIVASEDYYTFYEQSQTSLKRYAPEDDGKGGMVGLKYKQATVFHDTSASGIPAAHMYFMNTNYLSLVVHEDADMEVMDELRTVNQDAIAIPCIHQCNLTVANRKLQGVLKA
jgi:hypothetical protein